VQSAAESPATPAVESAGVENLIGRLRDEGIAQGRSQAQALVVAAQKQASDIIATAQREAESILAKAKEEAGKLKSLEGDLVEEFRNRLFRLVKGLLVDPAFLQRLILEVASKAAWRGLFRFALQVLQGNDLVREHFVLSLGGGMLREGMSFGVADDGEAGVRVRLVDDDVRIDLTESAISELLLRHMLPRFRALLRGAGVVSHDDAKPEVAAILRPRG
jgi:V/A-type H+-transporting ATPase subunit E